MGSFFLDTKGPLFCSFVQQPQTSTTSNLNNSNLRSASKTKRKNKRDVHNLENTPLPPLFFRTFLKFFGLHQRAPLHLFRYFATQWMSKNRKGSPLLHFFGTVTLFKNLIKKFLEIFSCLQRVPTSIFFKFFATSWSFTKPEGSPFQILSLRYGADFGRSRLVAI